VCNGSLHSSQGWLIWLKNPYGNEWEKKAAKKVGSHCCTLYAYVPA